MLKLRDFLCLDCNTSFEKMVKSIYDVECPHCGSSKTQFQHSPLAIKVNGEGAYSNKMKV